MHAARVIPVAIFAALVSGPAAAADFTSVFGLYNGAERRFVLEPRYEFVDVDEAEGRFYAAALEKRVFRVFQLDDGMRTLRPSPNGLPISGTQFFLFAEPDFTPGGAVEKVRFGLKTQTGEVLIPAVASLIQRFGFSMYVAMENNKARLYDSVARKWLDGQVYDRLVPLNASKEVAFIRVGNKVGLLSASGKEVLPVAFDAMNESRGYVIATRAGKKQLYALDGKRVLEGEYDWLQAEPPGLVWFGVLLPGETQPRETNEKDTVNYPTPRAVIRRNYRVGLMRIDGTVLIDAGLEGFGNFNEGVAVVRKDGRAAYVDRDGKLRTEFEFNTAGPFIDGFASVSRERRFGIIDRDFKMVVPAEYTEVGTVTADGTLDSENDALFAKKGDRYYFFDPRGRQLTELEAALVHKCDYMNRYCLFVRDKKTGMVSHTGEVLLKPEFDEIAVLPAQRIAIVKRDNKWGAVRYPGGAVVLELKYDNVETGRRVPVLIARDREQFEVLNLANGERRALPRGAKRVEILSERYLRVTTAVAGEALLDVSGNVLLEPRAQTIKHLLEDLFIVER